VGQEVNEEENKNKTKNDHTTFMCVWGVCLGLFFSFLSLFLFNNNLCKQNSSSTNTRDFSKMMFVFCRDVFFFYLVNNL